MKKTKIVCTIGPASDSREVLQSLLDSGMNIMRLNFSHGDYEEHGRRIDLLKSIMHDSGKIFAIILDTKGPEIRTTKLEGGKDVELTAGEKLVLTTEPSVIGTKDLIGVTYKDLAKDIKIGDTILLDDGLIGLKVLATDGVKIDCEILNGGMLGEHKGINLPYSHISMPFMSDKDRSDLLFGIEKGVDFIAASFTRCRQDVRDMKEFLDTHGGQDIKIICKIENQEGLDNFDEILEEADGIMVARGDMGVEIPVQEVIFAQKRIIKRCIEVGKSVITATQMLDSMIKNPRPTRAEAGDVANAILDGTDAVMLSGESAKGKYPQKSVITMSTICERTDGEIKPLLHQHQDDEIQVSTKITAAVSLAAVEASETLQCPLIVVATEHGGSPRALRKHFPSAQILALTPNEKTARQLCVVRGVIPKIVERMNSTDEFFRVGKKLAKDLGLAKTGDNIIMVNGALVASGRITNTMSVHTL